MVNEDLAKIIERTGGLDTPDLDDWIKRVKDGEIPKADAEQALADLKNVSQNSGGVLDDEVRALEEILEGTSNLDNVLVDLIDDAGKVAADKFDDVIRKVDAGDFADADLKRLVVETKDALTNNQKGILGEAVSDVLYEEIA